MENAKRKAGGGIAKHMVKEFSDNVTGECVRSTPHLILTGGMENHHGRKGMDPDSMAKRFRSDAKWVSIA